MTSTSLDLALELTCELDGRPVKIFSAGRKITVEADSIFTVKKAVKLFASENSFRSRAKGLKLFLESAGFQLESRVDGRVIGRIGNGIGSRFWCLFGLPAMQLNPYAIIASMARNR